MQSENFQHTLPSYSFTCKDMEKTHIQQLTILHKVSIDAFTSSIYGFVLSVPIGPPLHSKILYFRLLLRCIHVQFLSSM